MKIIQIKPYKDARGEVYSPFLFQEMQGKEICHFHIYSIERGAVRGNHKHPERDEYLFNIEGQADLYEMDEETGAILGHHHFSDKQHELVYLKAGRTHFVINRNESTFIGASFSPNESKGEDTIRSKYTIEEIKEIAENADN